MAHSFGYGDPTTGTSQGQGGTGIAQSGSGYGEHLYGYGHPNTILGWHIHGGSARHDLGGEFITVDSGVPNSLPAGPYTVRIGNVGAYSGVVSQGFTIRPSEDLSSFSVVTPNLFGTTGAVDIVITHGAGSMTISGILYIHQHPGRTMTTFIALRHPREAYLQRIFSPRG